MWFGVLGIASNSTKEGRQNNRRVDIIVKN
jgi:flagellar motor protein MotB